MEEWETIMNVTIVATAIILDKCQFWMQGAIEGTCFNPNIHIFLNLTKY